MMKNYQLMLMKKQMIIHNPLGIMEDGMIWALQTKKENQIPLKLGDLFSLIPFSTCTGVSMSGAKFSLKDAELYKTSRSLSNIAHSTISISFVKGEMLFYVKKDLQELLKNLK